MLRSAIQFVARKLYPALAILLLVGCGGDADEPSNPYHLTADIQGDPSIERTWVEPETEKVAVLSSGPAYTLYNPAEVDIGRDGRIYVFDGGQYHVEGFTRDTTVHVYRVERPTK